MLCFEARDGLVQGNGSTIGNRDDLIIVRHTPHRNDMVASQGIALDNFTFYQLSGLLGCKGNLVLHVVWEIPEDIAFR